MPSPEHTAAEFGVNLLDEVLAEKGEDKRLAVCGLDNAIGR